MTPSRRALGLPMGITDYELKKVLPTKAQLAKCVADAERQIELLSATKGTKNTKDFMKGK